MNEAKKDSSKNFPSTRKKKFFKYSLSVSHSIKFKNLNKIHKNPMITLIQPDSKFIYDLNEFKTYFSKVKNKNNLKLNETEIKYLKDTIDNILEKKMNNKDSNNFEISIEFFNKINSFIPSLNKKDEVVEYIKDLINNKKDKAFLSCRRIAYQYYCDTGKTISKTRVHNILKNKLNMRYRKTTIKNSKVQNNRNILMSLCFIKIIVKCIKLNYRIIFVDESSIQTNNNNFRTWRLSDEKVYFNLINTKKKNLLAAVDNNKVIYYIINDENTSETIFLDFMKKLKEKLDEEKVTKYVIVLDNLACHKTKLLKDFYLNNDINIVFNSPYMSNFNCIELFFRLIKRKIYQKIYSSINEVVDEITSIIHDNSINLSLNQNFRETLEEYLKYSNEYMKLNLNYLNYE